MPSGFPDLAELPPEDKMLLAAELWSEAADSDVSNPDPELFQALEARMTHLREHPGTAMTWDEVKRKIGADG